MLFGINRSIRHVDLLVVVIPGAFGWLATGLIYGIFSHWGFFRHDWLTCKWAITVAAILFGTFFLDLWETRMMEISGTLAASELNRNWCFAGCDRLFPVFLSPASFFPSILSGAIDKSMVRYRN